MTHSPVRLFTLGPAGTFSDKAAQRLRERLAAPATPIEYTRTIPEVLQRAAAEPDALGVFPIENSDNGTVGQAQDSLTRHRVTILWEINVPVRFSILANAPLERIDTLYAHPQAHDQCSEFLAASVPQGRVVFTNSNMESGLQFLEAPQHQPTAAVVPAEFGAEHAGQQAAQDIQNYKENTTRFLAVRKALPDERHDFTRGKTALLIEPDADRAGLLYELLRIFNRYGINLCRLESRPDRIKPWNYVFFIDFNNNDRSAECIAELQATPNRITVLGSFDLVE